MRFLAAVLLGLIFQPGALAQDNDPDEAAIEFALNNSIFVLYHEIGHLFVGEFGIPILGREEDAADNIAALLLLSAETVEADNTLIDSADGWFLSDAAAAEESETFEDAEFSDSHSLDVQRAFQIVCLMVGSDAEIFGEIATNSGLEEERQETCAADFEQTAASWNAVLEPYENDGSHSIEITIKYEPSEDYAGAMELLQGAKFFENAAEYILRSYALPRPIAMRGAECEEPNAYYDPEVGEVVFCYEMVDHFYGLFLDAYDDVQ